MQTDFEENWDDSFTDSLDLISIAEDINRSLKFNQGAWSCHEYKTDGNKVTVLGDYEYEGKYGDINWVSFEIVLTKNTKDPVKVGSKKVAAGTESIEYFYTVNLEGDVDAKFETKVKNKVRAFFEQYDQKVQRK